jgi:hypothetical protein
LVYGLVRGQISGVPLIRWPQWALLIFGLVWGLAGLPGGWWVASVWLVLLVILQAAVWQLRRHNYVTFYPQRLPQISAQPLAASVKIPIFVSGLVAVEHKERRFTWLPAFYRTFASREHALLCQVGERPALSLGQWAEGEPGLWYVFFTPEAIQAIHWGVLTFGRNRRQALAVQYSYLPPRKQENKPPAPVKETVYLAVLDEAAGHTILADLLYDWPLNRSTQTSKPERRLPTSPQDQ